MKTSTLLFSAALALSSAASSFGQVITTLETVTAWNGTSNLNFQVGQPISQTMKLPVATPAIYSMSWRFFASVNNPVTSISVLDAYFAEWNTSLNSPTGSPLWSSTNVTLPAFGSGNYDLVLTPNLLTDPTKTYAMILIGTSLSANLQVAIADTANNFTYGRAARLVEDPAFSYNQLTTVSSNIPGGDWVFSQIIISDSVLTPIPETGSVAVAFAGMLVAGLGLRRRYSARRTDVSAPALAA